jgi:hypothetical protein
MVALACKCLKAMLSDMIPILGHPSPADALVLQTMRIGLDRRTCNVIGTYRIVRLAFSCFGSSDWKETSAALLIALISLSHTLDPHSQ